MRPAASQSASPLVRLMLEPSWRAGLGTCDLFAPTVDRQKCIRAPLEA